MSFSLRHFIWKRKLTLATWATNTGINSTKEYDEYIRSSEFTDDLSVRSEIETIFANKTPVAAEVEEVKKAVEVPAVPMAESQTVVEVPTVEPTELEDKPSKKKRSKTEPDPV